VKADDDDAHDDDDDELRTTAWWRVRVVLIPYRVLSRTLDCRTTRDNVWGVLVELECSSSSSCRPAVG